jgi:Uma2 family endonuclease
MTAKAISEKRYTVEEYLEFEEASEIRHEFHEGFLYPIDGTSDAHNEIIHNITGFVRPLFRGTDCKMYGENVKLEIVPNGKYVYPDILFTCHEADRNSTFIKQFPSLIIEVLSKKTENYDRNGKFKLYQLVPSIQYYLMIDSRWQTAELYCRTDDPEIWTYQSFKERAQIIYFPKLNFSISLDTIYQDLNLPKGLTFILGGSEEQD